MANNTYYIHKTDEGLEINTSPSYPAKWRLGPVETKAEALNLAQVISDYYSRLNGLEAYINATSSAAAVLGRSKSPAKTAAARANGKKGGRPKKSKLDGSKEKYV